MSEISELVGKTIKAIEVNNDKDVIKFTTDDFFDSNEEAMADMKRLAKKIYCQLHGEPLDQDWIISSPVASFQASTKEKCIELWNTRYVDEEANKRYGGGEGDIMKLMAEALELVKQCIDNNFIDDLDKLQIEQALAEYEKLTNKGEK